ncbi:hypothetical protein B0H17DRAFT_1049953 [Mycena rosella]|uniref:Uncharacterized protein n=1 Tax=Mycena rosella TaxID=1033263 RepID=A0AAD7DT29_MYCRO|nr:hypothetical protein B0H17DRAFT_1049953 [Mycena rosella]
MAVGGKGWHCRKCGRLSRRSAWGQLYLCPNCNDTHASVGTVRPAKTLMSVRVPIPYKFINNLINPWSGIQRVETKIFNHSDVQGATGHYQIFILPEKKYKGASLPGILNAELTHKFLNTSNTDEQVGER